MDSTTVQEYRDVKEVKSHALVWHPRISVEYAALLKKELVEGTQTHAELHVKLPIIYSRRSVISHPHKQVQNFRRKLPIVFLRQQQKMLMRSSHSFITPTQAHP